MSDDVDNIILEHLRLMRQQITNLDRKVDEFRADVDRRLGTLSQRIDASQTEVRGTHYLLSMTVGSMLAEHSDLKDRVTALEPVSDPSS